MPLPNLKTIFLCDSRKLSFKALAD